MGNNNKEPKKQTTFYLSESMVNTLKEVSEDAGGNCFNEPSMQHDLEVLISKYEENK